MSPLLARRPRSVVLAVCWVAAGAWAIVGFAEDRAARGAIGDFVHRFTLDQRRPLEVAAMDLERSSDGVAAIAVDAALDDVRRPGPSGELSPELRAAWAESARLAGPELDAARTLILDAATRRPAKAQHRFLLGQVAYADWGRKRAQGMDAQQWIVPLSLAGAAAPGLDPIFAFLGAAYVDSWPVLSPAARGNAAAVWQRAFVDAGFVARSVLPASAAIGRDEALKLLPDEATSLRAASNAFGAAGRVDATAQLRPRLDRALRQQRALGIKKIAQRREAGDLEGARAACLAWLAGSSIGEFDDPAGRAQAARLLELWPNDIVGSWATDPRSELIRFFLGRREKDVSPDALRRATEALTGVPETVRARVWLLAGDAAGADAIRRRSAGAGSSEWTPFFVEVARRRLGRGDPKGAGDALRQLSAAAAEGCDALVARRDVAAALADQAEVTATEERLRRLNRVSIPEEAWSAAGSMTLCLNGEERDQKIRVTIEAENPAMVDYGWDGGRSGSVSVPKGSSVLALPMPPDAGRRILSLSSQAGGPIRPGAATVGPGG